MANAKYSELLKDPRWQRKRLEILERDNWTCQWCKDKDSTLHVHHKKYQSGKKPWEYDNSYLLTLCEGCHEDDYQRRDVDEKRLLDAMRLAGLSRLDLDDFLTSIPLEMSPAEVSKLFLAVGILLRNQSLQDELYSQLSFNQLRAFS